MSFLSSLFGGGSSPQINFKPQGFNGGGISFNDGNLTQSPQLSSQVGQLQSTFGQQAGALGTLARTVAPGFSQGRQAGLSSIDTQQQATTSNLRDNLAQRRILGSSFAQNAISQSDAEFAAKKADFQAQSYLQELSSTFQVTQAQYQAATQQFSTGITQMNFESGLAANLTASNNQINAQIASANAQLQMQQQKAQMDELSGLGSFIGTLGTARTAGGGSVFGSLATAGLSAFGA